uniref:C-type lectin domain-containing protein n=1 Tax=Acanthochromis polyacanthus TaxID=80966 RepID=A0A3Q1G933_9TELE
MPERAGARTELCLTLLFTLTSIVSTGSHLCCVSSGTCPSEWKQFGGSCYYFSLSWSSWNSSRQQCLSQRAHLVVISSRQEMVSLSAETSTTFWIGLSQTSSSSNWEWTDGRSPEAMYWRYGHPLTYLNRRCAVFNSFAAGSCLLRSDEGSIHLLAVVNPHHLQLD